MTTIEWRHRSMQVELFLYLLSAAPATIDLFLERGNIDIAARCTAGGMAIIEVKSFDEPTACIRDALGQILLYAARASHVDGPEMPLALIIYGRNPLSQNDARYLDFITKRLHVPLAYFHCSAKADVLTFITRHLTPGHPRLF